MRRPQKAAKPISGARSCAQEELPISNTTNTHSRTVFRMVIILFFLVSVAVREEREKRICWEKSRREIPLIRHKRKEPEEDGYSNQAQAAQRSVTRLPSRTTTNRFHLIAADHWPRAFHCGLRARNGHERLERKVRSRHARAILYYGIPWHQTIQ